MPIRNTFMARSPALSEQHELPARNLRVASGHLDRRMSASYRADGGDRGRATPGLARHGASAHCRTRPAACRPARVERQAVGDALRSCARAPNAPDLELHPVATGKHEGLAVEIEEQIPTGVARRRHANIL